MMWLVLALGLFLLQIASVLVLEHRKPAKAVAWLTVVLFFPFIGFIAYSVLAKDYVRNKRMRDANRKPVQFLAGMKAEPKNAASRTEPRNRASNANLLDSARQAGENAGKETADRQDRPGRSPRPAAKASDGPQQAVSDRLNLPHRLKSFLSGMPEFPITSGNRVHIFNRVNEAYDAMIRAMEAASSSICIEFYIIRDDKTGIRFQQTMMKKAKEGVAVRLLYDGLGSYKLGKAYISELKRAGVEVYSFLPPLAAFFNQRINYRNHRKIVVIDGTIGFLGGINIGDEYLGENPELGFWRDTHLRLEGDCVRTLLQAFADDWKRASGTEIEEAAAHAAERAPIEPDPDRSAILRDDEHWYGPKPGKLLGIDPSVSVAAGLEDGLGRRPDAMGPMRGHAPDPGGGGTVQIIAGGPYEEHSAVQQFFFSAMVSAKERIYVATPYFIPDRGILTALKNAALSGIDVRILLPGPKTDSVIVQRASLTYAKDLMKAGVRVYLYKKGFMHAKTMLIDRSLASVGSANMDMRSMFANFEVLAVLFDPELVRRIESDFEKDLLNSAELDWRELENQPRMVRFKYAAARLLAPLL